MKLSELAQEYNLEADLLQEVVEQDLSIPLKQGKDTVLKPTEVARILACDGLETADGKPFTPIIAKEFEEKHKRSLAAKKAAETRKKKVAEEAESKKKLEETKIAGERVKHHVELERRRVDEEARLAAEIEAERVRVETEERVRKDSEEARISAEQELQRRESESKRMAAEFAAIRQQGVDADEAAAAAIQAAAPAVPQARTGQQPSDAPTEQPPQQQKQARAAETTAPATAAPEKIEPRPEAVSKIKGLGSKLASLAKATHEAADHSTKAIPKPTAPADYKPAAAGSDPSLSAEDRRKLIQANIARNLDMAKRVQIAKTTSKKKPGFAPIDRTKTPGPNRPGGPGRGPGGPAKGGPPRPGRGPKRDSKDHRTEQEIADEEAAGKAGRRWKSTLDEDISGVTEFTVTLPCTLREFSEAAGVKASIVIAKLFMAGVMANINSVLEKDAIELLAQEFKKTVTIKLAKDVVAEVEEQAAAIEDKAEDLAPRPPVVTIMGHVDHGKTSLLDAIRKTNLTAGEAGGITQHIGAYTVTTASGLDVTFIDTPGHQAFTEMRARGAQVTDVAVIVVAADDGVMPQTVEAINHAKAAGVAVIVAMNKIDKPGIDKQKVLRQLAENGLQSEEWGGEIAVIGTSATTGEGVDELLERLALEADVLELKANHFANATGTVIEAHRNEGQGVTATFIINRGSLAVGDVVLAGTGFGKVRNMTNWKGEKIALAGPSHAVEIIGLNDMPRAGDRFQVMDDLKQAADAADARRQAQRERDLASRSKTTTAATIFGDIAHSKKKEIRVVVKADAAGSIEVLNKTIADLATDEVRVTLIHTGVGGINSSDVTLAEASEAMIVGFHVIADGKARALADQHHLEIRIYTVIYELLDDLKKAMSGMLDPEMRETVIGHAEVRNVFSITKVGMVAGLFVTDGVVRRDAWMRITRDNTILHSGKVSSLRRFKEDVKDVKQDFECGMTIENFQDIKVKDIMEFFSKEKIARTL
ncbi:MAG: translation initiation factor IF-2 [Planctomycetes bacterium]|nr:translation initiation factor IF-2 [Planctomycetota bacterium]